MGFLTADDWEMCRRRVRHELVPIYHAESMAGFTVEIDAVPLAVLAESAARGSRVYEFMSIRRPGDILHYLQLWILVVSSDTQKRVNQAMGPWEPSKDDITVLPYTSFSALFSWVGDDTTDEARYWLSHCEALSWKETMKGFLADVSVWQKLLTSIDDYLLQYELDLINRTSHCRDFDATMDRYFSTELSIGEKTTLPDALLACIEDLIHRKTVQSISCDSFDHHLWRIFVGEQVRRARRLSVPPQVALGLNGPDGAISIGIDAADWGGEVHIPFEGACDADLFIKPRWYRFNPQRANEAGRLLLGPVGWCHYLLTEEDYSELSCARRSVLDDGWILYESNAQYCPNNRFTTCTQRIGRE